SLYGTISSLLNEYRLVSPKISLETVDYLRDPAAGQKVKDEYKLPATTDKDLVIFDCEGQLPIVLPGDALAKYIMEQLPSEKEIEKIDQYLSQGGRLLALFNFYSADKDIGLERILAKWGVEVGHNMIVYLETTGRTVDLVVTDFSTSHPVVNPLLQDMIDLIRP